MSAGHENQSMTTVLAYYVVSIQHLVLMYTAQIDVRTITTRWYCKSLLLPRRLQIKIPQILLRSWTRKTFKILTSAGHENQSMTTVLAYYVALIQHLVLMYTAQLNVRTITTRWYCKKKWDVLLWASARNTNTQHSSCVVIVAFQSMAVAFAITRMIAAV